MPDNLIETYEGESDSRVVMLIITQSCNCACLYCYESHKSSERMSFETARRILTEEFKTAAAEGIHQLRIDFMGGEPLLNFELIRTVCEWLWSENRPLPYKTFARTNGLLLNEEMRSWFELNHERFSLGLSMDGLPEMHRINRSQAIPEADFFLKNWPGQPIKMILFPDSIHLLAESVIAFHEKQIPFTASLGEGFPWGRKAEDEFERQLGLLVDYYISHPHVLPIAPLLHNKYLNCCFDDSSLAGRSLPVCGDAKRFVAYDCNGTEYPCHMFSPVCLGKELSAQARRELPHRGQIPPDPACADCPARFICKRCIALDYKTYGNVTQSVNRQFLCRLQRMTLKASGDICMGRLASIMQQRELTCFELEEGLKALQVVETFTPLL